MLGIVRAAPEHAAVFEDPSVAAVPWLLGAARTREPRVACRCGAKVGLDVVHVVTGPFAVSEAGHPIRVARAEIVQLGRRGIEVVVAGASRPQSHRSYQPDSEHPGSLS